ncbi:MAG: hypothetical protein R3E79_27745 [Caldilineaceae bacterium]
MATRVTDTPTRTGSPWGGAVTAGIISLIVNVIIAWIIWLIIPPADGADLGWTLTMIGITSFFAGLFSYYGAFRQSYAP